MKQSCLSTSYYNVESENIIFFLSAEYKDRDADGFSEYSLVLCVILLSCEDATYFCLEQSAKVIVLISI